VEKKRQNSVWSRLEERDMRGRGVGEGVFAGGHKWERKEKKQRRERRTLSTPCCRVNPCDREVRRGGRGTEGNLLKRRGKRKGSGPVVLFLCYMDGRGRKGGDDDA